MLENSAFYLSVFASLMIGIVFGVIFSGNHIFSRFSPLNFENMSLKKELENFREKEKKLNSGNSDLYNLIAKIVRTQVNDIEDAKLELEKLIDRGNRLAKVMHESAPSAIPKIPESVFTDIDMTILTRRTMNHWNDMKVINGHVAAANMQVEVLQRSNASLRAERDAIQGNFALVVGENALLKKALGPLSPESLAQIERLRKAPVKAEGGGAIIEG